MLLGHSLMGLCLLQSRQQLERQKPVPPCSVSAEVNGLPLLPNTSIYFTFNISSFFLFQNNKYITEILCFLPFSILEEKKIKTFKMIVTAGENNSLQVYFSH